MSNNEISDVNRCSEGDIGLISDIRRRYWFYIRYAPASYRKISDMELIWYVPGTDHICFISDMKHGVPVEASTTTAGTVGSF